MHGSVFMESSWDLRAIYKTMRRFNSKLTWNDLKVSKPTQHDSDLRPTLDFGGTFESTFQDLATPTKWNLTLSFRADLSNLVEDRTAEASGRVEFDAKTLALKDVHARLGESGTLSFDGVFPIDHNREKATFHLQWHSVPLKYLAIVASTDARLRGVTSGRFAASSPSGSPPTVQAWNGEGSLAVDAIEHSQIRLRGASARLALEDGRLFFSHITVGDSSTILGRGEITLVDPFAYSIQWSIDRQPISRFFDNLDPQSQQVVSGLLSSKGTAKGDLRNDLLDVRGNAQFSNLRWHERQVADVQLTLANMQHRADRLEVIGRAFGGRIRAIADLPMSSSKQKQLLISVRDLRLDEITTLANLDEYDLQLEGRLNGKMIIDSWDKPEKRAARIQLTGARARVQYAEIPIDELSFDLKLQHEVAAMRLKGKMLEGAVVAEWKASLATLLSGPIPIDLHLHSVKLEGLAKTSPRYRKLSPLQGVGDLDMKLSLNAGEFKVRGAGDVELREVWWNRKRISPALKANMVLDERFLRLQSITASVAGGNLRGWADWPLSTNDAGNYDFTLRRLELADLLELHSRRLWRASGTIDARFTGRTGKQLRGRGDVRLHRLTFNGMEANAVQLPVSYSLRVQPFGGNIVVRGASGRIASGRISSVGTIKFGRRLSVNLETKITRLNFAQLSKSAIGNGTYGQGRLSGTLTLAGNGVRSVRDLDGRFRGTLEDSHVMRLPVLDDLVAFTNVGTMTGEAFDSDLIDLRLHDGVLSTPGLALKNGRSEVFIRGRVYLDQRLDLEVASQTGNINPDFGLGNLVRSPLTNFAVPGASIVTQSLSYLSNRVIYVHVGGTVRSPHFQLRTDRMLRDALLRYYLPDSQYRQTQRIR